MSSDALEFSDHTTRTVAGHRAVEVVAVVDASPEQVFDVLADGWLYALWVVGASHIRDVDVHWPDHGARIHHSVGPWPFTLEDTTEVLEVDRPHSLELSARAWPVGSAWIGIFLRPFPPAATEIRFAECLTGGPGRLVPAPLQALPLIPRNRESLRRLTDLVIGRRR